MIMSQSRNQMDIIDTSFKSSEKPILTDFKPRLYQETIFNTCTKSNTLVVIPTGMGKTAIALMVAANRINLYPGKKILFLAPTRPLVQQHLDYFKAHLDLDNSSFEMFTGQINPKKREELWKEKQFIFSTPQGFENDVITGRIKLEDVSLLIFDEAHKATGDYAYSFIAKQYNRKADFPRILALTASPGSDIDKINEVCNNLHIEDVEIRTDQDPDVKPYIQDVKIEFLKVKLPNEFVEIGKFLKDCIKSKLIEIKQNGYLNYVDGLSKTDILKLQGKLQALIAQGNKDFEILRSISLAAEAMKVQHALELLESQGIKALNEYFLKIRTDAISSKTKATQNLAKDLNFKSAWIKTEHLMEKNIEHPKLGKLRDIISSEISKDNASKKEKRKIIVFNQFRDTASVIVDELNTISGVSAKLFVGQAKKKGKGLSQKEQKIMLDEFRNGEFNVLVATSVAEEGIDIPKVDLVVFYEPIPSAIRHIQRRGRTGRLDKGKVIILVAEKTRDEGYRWSAFHKEKRMHRNLNDLKKRIKLDVASKANKPLDKFMFPKLDVKIITDDREKGSGIIKELVDLGIKVDMKRLSIGDYLLSSRVCVEFKTAEDFVSSILDGRLLLQLKELKRNYEKPLVIVEGTQDIFSIRNIHPNSIRGMLATIAVSYGIPVLFTKNFKETSTLLAMIAKREQDDNKKEFSLHTSKPLTLKEQQEYIVSALPSVGPNLAKELLEKFGSVLGVFAAEENALKEVDNLGEGKAKKINDVLNKSYDRDLREF